MNIELLTPIITRGVRTLDDVRPLEHENLKITHCLLESGPASIESKFDEALAVPDTLRKAIEAERNGAGAVVIDCMGDPGLHACREAVSIPVLGAGQTAMHLASMLGHRFSFITVLDRIRPMVEDLVSAYGLREKYASFQAVDIPVLELTHDLDVLNDALAEKAMVSIEQDGADIVVLGCTGFLGCAEAMRASLLTRGYDVPVIDPIPATVLVAEALIKAGISHSKHAYPCPEKKPIAGYDLSP
ncbi:MAG: aspartate/glutamate racemase family protein [Bryobacterales bacterium]|nr:aspartate/glutamate racemase family protein [Bryobacterales bacterium]